MNFDLNIKNYNKNELEEMFDLRPNYDESMIELNEKKMRESIMNDNNLNIEFQTKILQFINNAKEILKRNLIGVLEPEPITIDSINNHMVQEKLSPPSFTQSYPSQYFRGLLNPLKKKVREENLVIDTRFRESYYNSSPTNFNFQLPLLLRDVLSMKLTAIELPTTYYTISKQYNNNFFTLVVNSKSTVINIPDGNYDNNSFMISLNNQIILAGDDFKYIRFVININNFNSGSGQMMVGLDSSAPSDIEFELNFQADRNGYDDRNTPLPLKLGWIMGFRNGIYINNKNYVSEGVVDLSGPKYFYLVVDDFNNNNNNGLFYSAFNSSILNKNILARISLQTGLFKVLLQDGLNIITTARDYFGPVNINNFQVQLLDEYGRVVDLNYMDFSFCLTLTIAYDV